MSKLIMKTKTVHIIDYRDLEKYLGDQTFTFHQWINIKPVIKDEITLTVNGRDVKLSEETIKAIQEAL